VNAGTEPEIQGLAQLLSLMGAKISGAGTQTIEITGVAALHGAEHRIMPDRIEAGTFAIAAAMSGGQVEIDEASPEHMDSLVSKLRAAGAEVSVREHGLSVGRPGGLRAVNFQALPYPGLPTTCRRRCPRCSPRRRASASSTSGCSTTVCCTWASCANWGRKS
jgi:UDP-N-acetylglucosamine 1-carboxyvinyltransferase